MFDKPRTLVRGTLRASKPQEHQVCVLDGTQELEVLGESKQSSD